MLFPDVNVVVYAFRPSDSERAAAVRTWLLDRLDRGEQMGVSELVLSAFVRIATNGRIFNEPATPASALAFADSLLAHPRVSVVRGRDRHWPFFRELLLQNKLRGNDVPDAYLAALCLEAGATMATTDRGFRRFDGLRMVDPLA
ncbi:TA system VapC family ribonuclease toxin [Pseudactinotalea sp. HY158]|uniref:TA system VapC family ribonuclease toxin n=1 Tax=Pseudactinotalea sp. HY158 TaxID=2654547 RepID=UPI00129CF72F|nr:TA system VapC family ribonuclease toxin [Pseudactinotalea sp. HY158]QGH68189.1 PIN domain-containing protein [Pseudactinotalea sp. HY158]